MMSHPRLLLWIQTCKLRQQQAVVLRDGLFGGRSSQMALKGQNLLLLPLGDLQLPVDHFSFGVLVGHRTWRVGVVTEEPRRRWMGFIASVKKSYFSKRQLSPTLS